MGGSKYAKGAFLPILLAGGLWCAMQFDPLKGLDSNREYSNLELHAIVSVFCLSPAVGALLNAPPGEKDPWQDPKGKNWTLVEEGDIADEEYSQGSIYAILYAMYKNARLTSEHGVSYMFTFNTWGIAPSPYPKEDPQRHGKAAYRALVTQQPALDYIKKNNLEGKDAKRKLEILEIGCGTGAGANLITREVHPTCNYLALDMQQAAINTCNSFHATEDNPGLTCQVVPNGVGNSGNRVPREDSSVDFVVISETHIADMRIGDLEKVIFKEIHRVLRPGGLFLWGNALPIRVWNDAAVYLPAAGFKLAGSTNHTSGAVLARDEDEPRVELALKQLLEPYHVMQLPYFGERCAKVSNRLIANFYRHPGTALYLKMTTGTDSYMHQAWEVQK